MITQDRRFYLECAKLSRHNWKYMYECARNYRRVLNKEGAKWTC